MKFKTYDLLSEYLLGEDGTVLELSTGEALNLTPLKNYLLQTDETIGTGTYRLKRRYTPEEIIKMFNSPKAKDYKAPSVNSLVVDPTPPTHAADETMKLPYLSINGVNYQSARKAAEILGGNYNTILRKCKANKDGYFYIESNEKG